MIAALVTFFLVGLVGLVVLGVLLACIGVFLKAALGLAGILLFRIVPIVALGYLIVRFLAPRRQHTGGSGADLDL